MATNAKECDERNRLIKEVSLKKSLMGTLFYHLICGNNLSVWLHKQRSTSAVNWNHWNHDNNYLFFFTLPKYSKTALLCNVDHLDNMIKVLQLIHLYLNLGLIVCNNSYLFQAKRSSCFSVPWTQSRNEQNEGFRKVCILSSVCNNNLLVVLDINRESSIHEIKISVCERNHEIGSLAENCRRKEL